MARMIKRFDFDEYDISLEGLINVKDPEIVYEIINGIFHGIAIGSTSVDLFEIKTTNNLQTFSIKRSQWVKALNKCLESLIEEEDYETCAEVQKALSILNKVS